MRRERYSIIYSSKTGNTKKLAEAIYNTLPKNKCDYYTWHESAWCYCRICICKV